MMDYISHFEDENVQIFLNKLDIKCGICEKAVFWLWTLPDDSSIEDIYNSCQNSHWLRWIPYHHPKVLMPDCRDFFEQAINIFPEIDIRDRLPHDIFPEKDCSGWRYYICVSRLLGYCSSRKLEIEVAKKAYPLSLLKYLLNDMQEVLHEHRYFW